MRDPEDHCRGVPGLHALAVEIEEHVEVLDIGDFIGGHEPGAERAEMSGRSCP